MCGAYKWEVLLFKFFFFSNYTLPVQYYIYKYRGILDMNKDESDEDDDWNIAAALLSTFSTENKLSKERKLLILLDMNGTLVLRNETRVAGKAADIKVSKLFYYFRNNANVFIQWLSSRSSVFNIAFYTSMSSKYAVPAVNILTNGKNDIYLFDQPFNKKDTEGENSWSTMRDMPKIWGCGNSPAFGHSEYDTIMIDDSYSKMKEYPGNACILLYFDELLAALDLLVGTFVFIIT